MREALGFGIPILGARVLDFFNRRADDLLIGYFLGSVALGLYNVAYRILLMLTSMLTGSVTPLVVPTVAKVQDDPARVRSVFYQATQMTSLVSFPVFMGLVVMAPDIVIQFLGEQWRPSVPVVQVLAFVGMLHSVTFFQSGVLIAVGRPRLRLALLFLQTVANVMGFAIAVRWGIVAVAAGYVIPSYLLAPLELHYVRKHTGLRYGEYLRQYGPAIGGTVTMVVAVILVRRLLGDQLPPLVSIAVQIAVGCGVYGAFLVVFARGLVRRVLHNVSLLLPTSLADRLAGEQRPRCGGG